jgi:endoglucanase
MPFLRIGGTRESWSKSYPFSIHPIDSTLVGGELVTMPSGSSSKPSRPFAFLLAGLVGASTALATGYANQLGWPPNASKTVVLAGDGANLSGNWTLVRTSDQAVVATGVLPASKTWAPLGNDPAIVVRLPDLLPDGTYQLMVGGGSVAPELVVATEAWVPVAKGLLKGFYYQRSGIAIESSYGGQWARPTSFQSGYASYHPSSGKSTGGKNCPKGWYDAGDYNKYVVNSGITVWNLLALAENYSGFTDTLKWGIPEEGSGVPDLLSEARWNLDWMLTMQDDDGGVFHKWTQKQFGGFELPDRDTSSRWIVGKSAISSYDFAAVMAQASRLWKTRDPSYSATTLDAAKKAWAWANSHPSSLFTANPSDIATGAYDDKDLTDEKLWSSAELAAATGDQATYLPSPSWSSLDLPWWQNVGMLAAYTVVSHPKAFSDATVQGARKAILDVAATYAKRVSENAWASPQSDPDQTKHTWGNGDFPWGSNSLLAHMGVHMLYAWHLTGDSTYVRSADASMDHLMGRNPLGLCNVTGFGAKSPLKIHHRISGGDNVVPPVPGLLAGGSYGGGDDTPWSDKETWKCKDYRVSGKVALDWMDDECSYATNEIAINWNASAAHLAGALSAIHRNVQAGPDWSIGVDDLPSQRRPAVYRAGMLTLLGAATVELRSLAGKIIWRTEADAAKVLEVPRTGSTAILVVRMGGRGFSWVVASAR